MNGRRCDCSLTTRLLTEKPNSSNRRSRGGREDVFPIQHIDVEDDKNQLSQNGAKVRQKRRFVLHSKAFGSSQSV